MRSLLLLAALSAAPLAAQAATYDFISQPPQYGDPSPAWLTVARQPSIGGPLALDVPATVLGSDRFYLLITGATRPDLDLGTLSGPGAAWQGILYASTEIVQITPPPSTVVGPGRTLVSFPIPTDFSLIGITFHQQVAEVVLPVGSNTTLSVRMSRGGVPTVGL